jgi:hypothetical protein
MGVVIMHFLGIDQWLTAVIRDAPVLGGVPACSGKRIGSTASHRPKEALWRCR